MAYALRSRLNPTISNVFRRCQLPLRTTSYGEPACRGFASRDSIEDEEALRPAKYTSSKAHYQSAESARKEISRDDSPWAQTISLYISLGSFLIYFGILREENDLDDIVDRDIYEVVPGLKEAHEKMNTRAGRDSNWREMEKNL